MSQHDAATQYRTQDVNGLKIFYREAGAAHAPTILLLHGFPTSSHMFRDLIPVLAPQYHVIAPDLPGFGFSDAPSPSGFTYTFDRLADVIEQFTDTLGLTRYALYIFDYGAPVGLRLALRHPERITAIVSQNGNAYEEGLSAGWNPIQKYWADPTPENRAALRPFSRRRPPSGSTRTEPRSRGWLRNPMRSTLPYWRVPAMRRSSWICFSTMRAMSSSIPSSKSISVPTGHRHSPCGANPIRSFSRPGPTPSSGTTLARRSCSSTPGILPSKRIAQKSERKSQSF